MQRAFRWSLAAGLALALGCGQGREESQRPVAEDLGQTQAVPQARTDRALVQVVVYGLAAFHLKHDSAGKLSHLSAHLPKVIHPSHDLVLQQGIVDGGKKKWQDVAYLNGTTVTLYMKGDLSERSGASIGDYPASMDDAADAGWLLKATEIDDPTSFSSANASAHVTFQNGTLETCALVFPPETWKSRDHVCKTRVLNDKNVERSSGEIMVIRGWVDRPSGADGELKIDLTHGGQTTPWTVRAIKAGSVKWNGDLYDSVINVAIGNRSVATGRTMDSDHGRHLHRLFAFSGNPRSWKMDSPDCTSKQDCDCKPMLQPDCWTYVGELFKNSAGAYDRPICPLIGWNG